MGDTVKWVNNDSRFTSHIFQSIPGSNPYDINKKEIEMIELLKGESYKQTFNKIGRYPYFCFIHNSMRGEIIVTRDGQSVEDMIKELALLPKSNDKIMRKQIFFREPLFDSNKFNFKKQG